MSTSKKRTILITGAGGFVGRHTIDYCLEEGYTVRATDLPAADLDFLKGMPVEIIKGDLTRRPDVREMVLGVDVVVHVAAAFDLGLKREALFRANYQATKLLAEEARAAGVRQLVLCSTADIYGIQDTVPVNEEAPPRPENPYSLSKLFAERSALSLGGAEMAVTIIRPTMIYGAGSTYIIPLFCITPMVIERLIGRMPKLIGGPLVHAVHVRDVARALIYVIGKEDSYGQAYNIADDSPMKMGAFFQSILSPLGVKLWPPLPVTKGLIRMVAQMANAMAPDQSMDWISCGINQKWDEFIIEEGLEPAINVRLSKGLLSYGLGDHAFDNSKLKALGYELEYPDFKQGFAESLEWYRQHRWLPANMN